MITDKDVETYRETGWLVVERVFDRADVAEAKQKIAEVVAAAHSVTTHTDVYDLEPDHSAASPRVRRIKTPHKHIPLFWDLARSPKLVSILQKLLGPGIRLHGSKINMKAPHYGSPVEWHQDWAFYPHTNDDLLAVGVMLDDTTTENGAMLVLPGTHGGPVYDHHCDGAFCGAMDPSACDLEFGNAVPTEGPAGSISIHHVRLVHGSAQNTSNRPRTLLLYEYAAADAWPLLGVSNLAEFDSRLIRGTPTIEPRLERVPVRMPLPPAPHQGSIYENQTTAKSRYFSRVAAG